MTRAANDTRTAADFETQPRVVTGVGAGDIARVVHEANRAYCLALGDHSQVAFDDAPENIKASAIDGIRAVMEGRATTPEQQHQNWLDFKTADGWVYGEVKDAEAKTHPCMVPYADLPEDQRRKDHLFRAIVTALTEAV